MNFDHRIDTAVDQLLAQYGYVSQVPAQAGVIFENQNNQAVYLDTKLFDYNDVEFPYVRYTNEQNQLMHKYQQLLRFDARDSQSLVEELRWFFTDSVHDEAQIYGADRSDSHIDPTLPEYNFVELFLEVYGDKAIHALEAESIFLDRKGVRRYIDFVLHRKPSPIAIELNGEVYHHPLLTLSNPKKYRSQLFKQNSLVVDGYKVYRWSNRGMADSIRFADEIRDFFGEQDDFLSTPKLIAQREVSFTPYEHQQAAIDSLVSARTQKQTTQLIVLPTGTGKTEVFIEDIRQGFNQGWIKRALVIVPSIALREQSIDRFRQRASNLPVSGEAVLDYGISVRTSAWLLRHYLSIRSDFFDYIVVDEAHRAVAHGLKKSLSHFTPKFLLGLTATDERLDERKLSDVFGHYEVDMSLERAIEQGLLPTIRAFRLESSIDLSKVRFNGKDFVKSDLNKMVIVPSRDQLIVDVLLQYFVEESEMAIKQGVIFCVDINHAKRMAQLMCDHGLTAQAVWGTNRSALKDYESGNTRFLCACDLLNEGWDAPQTSLIVMARPTMSKVLYAQQLGRGTRKYPGKEALYVIDVIDNYGAQLQPWSVHNLFNLGSYQAFGDVTKTQQGQTSRELTILDNLWEGIRRIEPINIFNFEQEFADLLNEEQLARELFVSTGTIKSWIKKSQIKVSKSLDFGRRKLHYFEPSIVAEVRRDKGLKLRDENSRLEDFKEFIELRDYTFSYKIAFILAFLSHVDQQGEAKLDEVTQSYQGFYLNLFKVYDKAEKPNNPLNLVANLNDASYLSKSLLKNPFEKFERKRFVHHCKDLNLLAIDSILWEKLRLDDLNWLREQYIADAKAYYLKLEINLSDKDFDCFGLAYQSAKL